MAKLHAQAAQWEEYEDEYDDSFDDLAGFDADASAVPGSKPRYSTKNSNPSRPSNSVPRQE